MRITFIWFDLFVPVLLSWSSVMVMVESKVSRKRSAYFFRFKYQSDGICSFRWLQNLLVYLPRKSKCCVIECVVNQECYNQN